MHCCFSQVQKWKLLRDDFSVSGGELSEFIAITK